MSSPETFGLAGFFGLLILCCLITVFVHKFSHILGIIPLYLRPILEEPGEDSSKLLPSSCHVGHRLIVPAQANVLSSGAR